VNAHARSYQKLCSYQLLSLPIAVLPLAHRMIGQVLLVLFEEVNDCSDYATLEITKDTCQLDNRSNLDNLRTSLSDLIVDINLIQSKNSYLNLYVIYMASFSVKAAVFVLT
jgi:hypothetical protein